MYALVASGERPGRRVVGYLYVRHGPDWATIEEGRAFYLERTGRMVRRGEWTAETVWVGDRRIRLVFNMRSGNADYVDAPGLYEGYLELNLTRATPLLGRSSWFGHFHDLGDRRIYLGDVYGERLGGRACGWVGASPPLRSTLEHLQEALDGSVVLGRRTDAVGAGTLRGEDRKG